MSETTPSVMMIPPDVMVNRPSLADRMLFTDDSLLPPVPTDLTGFEMRRTQLVFRKIKASALMNTVYDSLKNNYPGCQISHDVDSDAFRHLEPHCKSPHCKNCKKDRFESEWRPLIKSGIVCGLSATVSSSTTEEEGSSRGSLSDGSEQRYSEQCHFDVIAHYKAGKYVRNDFDEDELEDEKKDMKSVKECDGHTLVLNWHLHHGSRMMFRQVFQDFRHALATWFSASYRPRLTCDTGFMATRSVPKPSRLISGSRSHSGRIKSAGFSSNEECLAKGVSLKYSAENLAKKGKQAKEVWEALEKTDLLDTVGADFMRKREVDEPGRCTWEDSLAIYVLAAVADDEGHVTNHLCYATQMWEELCDLPLGSVNHGACRFKEIKTAVGGSTQCTAATCSKMGKVLQEFGQTEATRREMLMTRKQVDGKYRFEYDNRSINDLLGDVMDPEREAVRFNITKGNAGFDIFTKALEVAYTDNAVVSVCVASAGEPPRTVTFNNRVGVAGEKSDDDDSSYGGGEDPPPSVDPPEANWFEAVSTF